MRAKVFRRFRIATWRTLCGSLLLACAVGGRAKSDDEVSRALRAAGIEITQNETDCGLTATFSREDDTSHCKRLAELSDLTRVRFVECTPSPSQLAELRHMSNLTDLDLLKAELDVEHFKAMGKMEGVRRMNLAESKLSDQCLKNFARDFPQLEALNLTATPVTNDALSSIASVETLRELSLAGSFVYCSTDYGTGNGPYVLDALAKHPRLERLDFRFTELGPKDLRVLGTLPALNEIEFKPVRRYISDNDLLQLKQTNEHIRIGLAFAKLYRLSCKTDSMGNIVDLRDLSARAARLAETKELIAVERFKIGKLSSFAFFHDMPAVRQLHLWRCSVAKEEWKHIAQMKDLELLVIEETPVDGAALEPLLALRSLKRLSIDAKSIEPSDLKQLSARLSNVDVRTLESFRVDGL